jgi:predicted PurR-regulated permease PerM
MTPNPELEPIPTEGGRLPGILFFAGAVLVVAILYWAQAIFIPIALAILFTFLLGPLVSRLEHWGLGRGPAVTVVVLLTLALLGAIVWLAALQVRNLADELPHYRANIRQKVGDLRNFQKGGVPCWKNLTIPSARCAANSIRGTNAPYRRRPLCRRFQ